MRTEFVSLWRMKFFFRILFVLLLGVLSGNISYAQQVPKKMISPDESMQVTAYVNNTDTIPIVILRDVYVFPPMKFKNKNQEKFYWRTVRDVKKTLPLAKIIAKEMKKTDAVLVTLPSKKEQKSYMAKYEKELFKQYESTFRKMTAKQGMMLMKLVDRECDKTSYEVIKYYKGAVTAFFWQGIARIFGNNLKVEFDAVDKDQIVERIILLVESGQL